MTTTFDTKQSKELDLSRTAFDRYQGRQPVLYSWIGQLQKAIRTGQSKLDLWKGVGRGLLVVDPDTDELHNFLMSAAGAIDGQYLRLSVDQFLECSETLIQESMPSIVFVEQGPWLFRNEELQELVEIRSKVRGVLDQFYLKESPVVVVTHATRFGAIAEQFRYQGAFDRHIFWASPNPALTAQDLYDQVGRQYLDVGLLENPERLGRVLSLDFPSSRRLGLLAAGLRRRAILQERKANWRDLIEICVNGTGEGFHSNEHLNLNNIATHEAGHAVVNIAGSDFKTIPDMVTIAPGNGTAGVAVESYHHTYERRGGNLTFADVCQRIRVCLAGRAAEEMEYGVEGCGAYASQNDLENASSMAVHLIMQNGFPANYDDPVAAGSNLFSVPDGSELGETKYYDAQLRSFLEKLYQQTKALLYENRELLDVMRRELLQQRYLMREDLVRILAKLRCCD